jgi:cell division protein FtsL
MKFFTALGGFLGFALVMAIGLAIGRRSAMLLLEASLACVIGSMLFRWWHRMLIQGVQASLQEKRLAAQALKNAQASAGNRTTSTRP